MTTLMPTVDLFLHQLPLKAFPTVLIHHRRRYKVNTLSPLSLIRQANSFCQSVSSPCAVLTGPPPFEKRLHKREKARLVLKTVMCESLSSLHTGQHGPLCVPPLACAPCCIPSRSTSQQVDRCMQEKRSEKVGATPLLVGRREREDSTLMHS